MLAFALTTNTHLAADDISPSSISPSAPSSSTPPIGNPPPIWVLLKNGSVISGQLQSVGERWRLRVPAGEIELPPRELEFAGHSPEEVSQFQYQRVDVSNLNARLDYVQWCLAAEFWTAAGTELDNIAQTQPGSPRYHRLRQTLEKLQAAAQDRDNPSARQPAVPGPSAVAPPLTQRQPGILNRGVEKAISFDRHIPTKNAKKPPPAVADPFDPAIFHARHGIQPKQPSDMRTAPIAIEPTPGLLSPNTPGDDRPVPDELKMSAAAGPSQALSHDHSSVAMPAATDPTQQKPVPVELQDDIPRNLPRP